MRDMKMRHRVAFSTPAKLCLIFMYRIISRPPPPPKIAIMVIRYVDTECQPVSFVHFLIFLAALSTTSTDNREISPHNEALVAIKAAMCCPFP